MYIAVTVTLGPDDTLLYTPDQAAAQVIAALGGNPTKDYCAVNVQQAATGTAGAEPPPTRTAA